MGHHCLRTSSGVGLVETVERSSETSPSSSPRNGLGDLTGRGDGLAFAPAGKVFREWVAIPTDDADR